MNKTSSKMIAKNKVVTFGLIKRSCCVGTNVLVSLVLDIRNNALKSLVQANNFARAIVFPICENEC
jgi:hypothetical protein